MEGFISIFGVIAIVAGVLYIMLFFKVWNMTNDVKQIKQHACPPIEQAISFQNKVIMLKMLGKEKEAYDLIVCRMDNRMNHLLNILPASDPAIIQRAWEKAFAGYKDLFSYIGASAPANYESFSFTNLVEAAKKLG